MYRQRKHDPVSQKGEATPAARGRRDPTVRLALVEAEHPALPVAPVVEAAAGRNPAAET